MSDALKDKIHLSHEATMLEMAKGPSMSRRAATDHTTCEACIANGHWWNSRICVEAKTYENQYFGLWGAGYQTDCDKPATLSVRSEMGCGSGEDGEDTTCIAGTTTKFYVMNMQYSITKDLGTKIESGEIDTENTCTFGDHLSIVLTRIEFDSGTAKEEDTDIDVPNTNQYFTKIDFGEYNALFCLKTKPIQMIYQAVALDAVYKYDKNACANGVDLTGQGDCDAEAYLTSVKDNVDTFRASDYQFVYKSKETVKTVGGVNAEKYSFCSKNTATSKGCLIVYFAQFFTLDQVQSDKKSDAVGMGEISFDCGTNKHKLDIFHVKYDIVLNDVSYEDGVNQRYGFRFFTLQQLGSATLPDDSSGGDGDEKIVDVGMLKLGMEKSMLHDNVAEATCDSTRNDNMLKSAYGNLKAKSSTTSCGYSDWFDMDYQEKIKSININKVSCVLGNFHTTDQSKYLLWDPNQGMDEEKANQAYAARASQGSSESTGSALPHALGFLIVAPLVFLISFF